eukprot:5572087-Alexandrium_andersonii.AAC.1
MTESHAIADSRRMTAKRVTRVLVKSLHSDKASGLIATLGPAFANLELMAHRVTQGLVDVEEAIGREFQRRK